MRRDRRAAEIDWRSPPDEVAAELGALRPAIPLAAWRGLAHHDATEVFLHALARAVTAADPSMVLATLVRSPATDTIVVAPMMRDDLRVAAKLVRAADLGSITDLAGRVPRVPTARTATRRGGWRAFLAQMNVANTHGLLLAAANRRAVASELARRQGDAPKSERAAIRVFLALLLEGESVETEEPLIALAGLRYLAFAPGQEHRTLAQTCVVLANAGHRGGIRLVRAVVDAIRFSRRPVEAAAAFQRLPAACQRALRDTVQRALESKDVATSLAARDAARVVGLATMRSIRRRSADTSR
jgi:hypothetical protein